MWTPLLLLALAAAPSPECRQVREVRAMAVREGLDETTLRELERRRCGPAGPTVPPEEPHRAPPRSRFVPPEGASEECATLHTLALLGRAAEADAALVQEVEGAREVACALGGERGRFSWRSGVTARSAAGSWSWPNGVTAKSASGSWSWPSGVTARSSAGSWSYPSGVTARSGSGRWSRPDGASSDEAGLLTDVCRAPGPCPALHELSGLTGDARALAVLVLAWEARPR